nr:nitroreductase family protein [Acetomicrobium sp. S15 = DSM 107314]
MQDREEEDVGTLLEAAKKRRSVRSYKPDPIPDEVLSELLEVFRWAPSGANSQPWEVVVTKDKVTISAIADIFIEQYERQRRKDPDFPGNCKEYLKEVPVIIVVCGDPRLKDAYPKALGNRRRNAIYLFSVGAAIENLLLSAAEQGLGTVWITPEEEDEVKLKKLLSIPEALEVWACIPVGYPKATPGSRQRRPLDEFVHWDSLDVGKLRSNLQIREFIATGRAKLMYGPGCSKPSNSGDGGGKS